MRSRREFIQLASISAILLATKPWNSVAAKQKLKIEDLLEFDTKGQVTLLHLTDLHGQLEKAIVIKNARNGFKCKRLARDIKVSRKWYESNVKIMHQILREKFKQCPEYRHEIEAYDNFVEDTWDKFWGKGGLNMLGKLHKQIKKEMCE